MREPTPKMAYFTDPYKEFSGKDDAKMVFASKCGDWETVWTILDKKPYLVNFIPKERAWAILHQAVWWKNQEAVNKILNIPGCDSELLTKNGLTPLDIETTVEIKKLLENHIKSNELSKASIFLNSENLIDEDSPKMVIASKEGHWDIVSAMLEKQPYLVNSSPKKEDWGILHHAVLRKDISAVKMILKIPGCNSEIQAKNGMRPLDIDTTVEIKELLTNHKESNEKASFFLTQEDKATPPDGIYPNQLTDDKLKENQTTKVEEMTIACKSQDWKKFFRTLNFWEHLINVVNPNTGMAPIHEAALAGDQKVMTELMSYKTCKIDVKTKKPAKVGAGKTAEQITECKDIRKAILFKLEEEKKKYNNEAPTYVEIEPAQLNLMYYVQGAMKNYTICEEKFKQDYFESFPAMEEKIFSFINTGNNWKSVMNIFANEIGRIDASETEIIDRIQDKMEFFTYLIKLYTQNNYYWRLNSLLRNHPLELSNVTTEIQSNQSFRVYTALANAVMFYANLPSLGKKFSGTTYRGIELSDKELGQYRNVGTKFAWLSFTSSSKEKGSAFGGCRFIINNNTKCPWSPRGIEKIADNKEEHEYLYPCGAHFEVTKFKETSTHKKVYMKLIETQTVLQHIQFIYREEKLRYDTLVTQYNQTYQHLFEKKKSLDAANAELHTLHLKMENLKKFENEVVENRSIRFDLPKGTEAYHCRVCNTTCDYPCPETHMYLGRCKFCIPTAVVGCTKCQGECHFTNHSRVGYRLEVELVTTTSIDEAMKADYAIAATEFHNKTKAYTNMKNNWEEDFDRLLKGTQLLEDMQKSIKEQTKILSAKKKKTWDRYGNILELLNERRSFVEECRFNLSEWDLL